jgi:HPt (histidine-containing phosphotransfer) domain-containing protein
VADNPIDEAVLDQLRFLQKKDRPDFPSMIVALYLGTTPDVLKELETAAAASEASLMHMAIHKLSSASAIIGATRLSALCKELEIIIRTGPAADATERVQAIAAEYKWVEAALRIWCVGQTSNDEPTAL